MPRTCGSSPRQRLLPQHRLGAVEQVRGQRPCRRWRGPPSRSRRSASASLDRGEVERGEPRRPPPRPAGPARPPPARRRTAGRRGSQQAVERRRRRATRAAGPVSAHQHRSAAPEQQVEREVEVAGGVPTAARCRRARRRGRRRPGVAVVEDLAQPLHAGPVELGQVGAARPRAPAGRRRRLRPVPNACSAATSSRCPRGGRALDSSAARSRLATAVITAPRRSEVRDGRSSSSATASSGPTIDCARCQVRRNGWSTRTSASARGRPGVVRRTRPAGRRNAPAGAGTASRSRRRHHDGLDRAAAVRRLEAEDAPPLSAAVAARISSTSSAESTAATRRASRVRAGSSAMRLREGALEPGGQRRVLVGRARFPDAGELQERERVAACFGQDAVPGPGSRARTAARPRSSRPAVVAQALDVEPVEAGAR